MSKQNSVKRAMNIVCTALREDPNYYIGWQATIAMAFYDEFNRNIPSINAAPTLTDIHQIANSAAKAFLDELMKLR